MRIEEKPLDHCTTGATMIPVPVTLGLLLALVTAALLVEPSTTPPVLLAVILALDALWIWAACPAVRPRIYRA